MASMRRARVLLLTLCLLSTRAFAEDEFRRHYEEGLTAYELGEFTRAAEAYKAAHRVRRDPALLYNIGQAYRLGGNLEQAVFFYRSYLRAVANPPNRRDLEERIRTLDSQIASQKSQASQPPFTLEKPAGAEKPAATPAPSATVAATPVVKADAPVDKKPIYKKWWLWAAVGGAVVVVGLGVGLGIGLAPRGPSADHSFTLFP